MVCRFVEKKQIGRQRKGERQRRALLLPAARAGGIGVAVQPEALEEFVEAGEQTPALTLVVVRGEVAAQRQRFAEGGRGGNRGLLLDVVHGEAVDALHFAVVEHRAAAQHRKERTLPRAVAANEPDAFARFDGEVGVVEKGKVTPGELSALKRDECHRRNP